MILFIMMNNFLHILTSKEFYDKVHQYSECSKTCGKCGNINDKLGSKESWKCPVCAHEHDRDVNGARNILLRALLDTTYSEKLKSLSCTVSSC